MNYFSLEICLKKIRPVMTDPINPKFRNESNLYSLLFGRKAGYGTDLVQLFKMQPTPNNSLSSQLDLDQ